ncbi:MAG: hypothetical protein MJZ11_10630 [Lachnospiraceae bacterium]|nr:hypothetical protein [Lachnospiraceae bacterium]
MSEKENEEKESKKKDEVGCITIISWIFFGILIIYLILKHFFPEIDWDAIYNPISKIDFAFSFITNTLGALFDKYLSYYFSIVMSIFFIVIYISAPFVMAIKFSKYRIKKWKIFLWLIVSIGVYAVTEFLLYKYEMLTLIGVLFSTMFAGCLCLSLTRLDKRMYALMLSKDKKKSKD